jgi:autotransporter-associated beta strand protein
MFLYDATSRLLLDWSDSAVDNVQDVFDQNLIPGHTYDLEVLKHGGAGALTNSETYAIAFSTTPDSGNPAGYPAVWTGGNASWGDNAQWYNQVIPEEGGETANFTDAISSPTTITLDANWTIGNINFFNTNAYTIAPGAGGGAIGIFNGNKTCDITDALGTHYITAPVYLLTSLQVTVVNTTDALQISGNISGTGSLIMYGAGTLTLSGSNSYQGGTTILTGGLVAGSPGALPTNSNVTVGDGVHAASLRLAPGSGPANLSSLQINVNSIVDIGNNSLTINYGQVVNDPIYDVVTDLISGYNNGTWTGTSGIISSAAAQAQGGPALSIGYADGDAETDSGASPNQILLKFTLLGDANLDGLVNFQDLVAVVQNFNKFGTDWAHGNFLYGETTSFNDLIAVVQNLNKILPTGAFDGGPIFTMPIVSATAVQVPEPSSLALIAAGAGGLLARRRRRTRTALNANAATPVGSGRTLSVSVVSVLVSSRV